MNNTKDDTITKKLTDKVYVPNDNKNNKNNKTSKRSKYMARRKQNINNVVRNLVVAFVIVISMSVITNVLVLFGTNNTIKEMHATYIRNTDTIIQTRSSQEMSNSWERLPENDKRERLRAQYTEIITYYTTNTEDKYRMSSEQVNATFNTLYNSLKSVPRINFFLAVAYMKVATNFNPLYNRDYKFGLAAFYEKAGEAVCNLPRVKTDQIFFTIWKGLRTLNDPEDAIKLLVARIDDLMLTFYNREDWVLLALFTNEYDIIDKYWDGGEGAIPESKYREGPLANVLMYYYAFKNWQIPSRDAHPE